MSTPIILNVQALGNGPWPTIDPFLFCVHHNDAYPRGNAHMGPDAALDGTPDRPGLCRQGRLEHVPR